MSNQRSFTDLMYAISESENRWFIVAGIAFGAAIVGAMALLAYDTPHVLDRIWFLVGTVAAVYCLLRGGAEWSDSLRQDSGRTAEEQGDGDT